MTAIDVGQGDSILLVSPAGHTLLVDAGGLPRWGHSDLDIGEDVVSPYLWSRAISRLDAVAITHTIWEAPPRFWPTSGRASCGSAIPRIRR